MLNFRVQEVIPSKIREECSQEISINKFRTQIEIQTQPQRNDILKRGENLFKRPGLRAPFATNIFIHKIRPYFSDHLTTMIPQDIKTIYGGKSERCLHFFTRLIEHMLELAT